MSGSAKQYWSKKVVTIERVNPFVKKVMKYVTKGMSVLDLGCGYGTDTLYLARKGMHMTALDFSAASVESVRKKTTKAHLDSVKVLQHDLSKKLPFSKGSFNAVYAHLSIHYFDDKTTHRIIVEIERILKPGGLIFVKCKSVDDPLYGKGEEVGPDTFRTEHVRHFFSKEYMQSLLADFKILSLRRASSAHDKRRSAFIEAIALKKSRC
jgi:ubiquinone/menaquinone biosynthesis C-methylase UbiE